MDRFDRDGQTRQRVAELVDEQAALRRVATLVAQYVPTDELFGAVSSEVGALFGADFVGILRYESDRGAVTTMAAWAAAGEHPLAAAWSPTLPGDLMAMVADTGEPARVEDWSSVPGPIAEFVRRELGVTSSVGCPIVVQDHLWGVLAVHSKGDPLPPDSESRLLNFTGLVATAIANANARAEASMLTEEQAALRRVATMVAQGSSPPEVFATVAESVAVLLGFEVSKFLSYDAEGHATVVGGWGWDDVSVRVQGPYQAGSRFELDGDSLAGVVYKTGLPARIDDYQRTSGSIGAEARKAGLRAGVGSPILVDGRLWGALTVGTTRTDPLAGDVESRLAKFCELVATAISNVEARAEVERLAYEQSALRRVATLVARAPASEQLFSTVAREVAAVLDVPGVIVTRYNDDGMALILGEAFRSDLAGAERFLGVGMRIPRDSGSLAAELFETDGPARVEEFSTLSGAVGDLARAARLGSACAAPIVVNGAVWGKLCVFSRAGTVLAPGTENRVHDFLELVATAIANHEARAELSSSEARARELAEEQAALRRVATLVARGVSPDETFAAVTDEVRRVFGAEAAIARFEPDGSAMVVVGLTEGIPVVSIGTRWELEDFLASTAVYRTGRSARSDHTRHQIAPGAVADSLREMSFVSTVAAPIKVEGRLWGVITVSDARAPLRPDTDERVGKFTELVGTAIANAESRAELGASEARAHNLATEQAALRRVATMVAQESPPAEVFATVAESVAFLLGFEVAQVFSYDPEGHATLVGGWGDVGFQLEGAYEIGTRFDLDGDSLAGLVYRSALPVRIDDYQRTSGSIGAGARKAGLRAGVGSPIIVGGRLWGALNVGTTRTDPVPEDAESRLAKFTELVATAISNIEARAEVERLAYEQSALRRIATLVARGVRSDEIFSAVTNELARLFGSPQTYVGRFEPDGSGMVVVGVSEGIRGVSIGTHWKLEDHMPSTAVYRTGRPVRVERSEFEHASGRMADLLRELNAVSNVGAPIAVEGRLWGFVTVTDMNKRLPLDADERLEKFTELLATAIANAESRAQLAASEVRARGLLREQAALRRVATLVAKGAKPEEVFSVVAQEIEGELDIELVTICQCEPGGFRIISSHGLPGFPPGSVLPPDVPSLPGFVHRARGPVRIDDFTDAQGANADARDAGVSAAVGAPIIVGGSVWGSICAAWTKNEPLPHDTEERLARFTDLAATSVSNAIMRHEVAASRARVIAAADDARRNIERDLHDGAQQRLVTLMLAHRRLEARIPAGFDGLRADVSRVADGLATAVQELRELSRGIHPAVLTEGGLSPALKALGRRSSVRVKLDVRFERRLPDQVEAGVYYTVSEALTNAAKHASGTRVWVSLWRHDDTLHLSIRDDGMGGADASRGSGLTGLIDRIDALGGKIRIQSPRGSGTQIEVEIPISGTSI